MWPHARNCAGAWRRRNKLRRRGVPEALAVSTLLSVSFCSGWRSSIAFDAAIVSRRSVVPAVATRIGSARVAATWPTRPQSSLVSHSGQAYGQQGGRTALAALPPPLAAIAARPFFYGLFVIPNTLILLSLALVYKGSKEGISDGDAMQEKWATYANKPIRRAMALQAGLIRFGFMALRQKLARRKEKKHELALEAGRRAVTELVRLGPTYVKLGQIISSRPDKVPKEYCEELKRLQDDVPAFSGARAKAILEAELKKPISEVFKDFDETPLAAASLGQVHRATLLDGREVAIKVQRDKLKEMYDLDLPQFDKVTDMMERFKIGVDAKTMFKDAKVILYREIDYLSEAENTRRLAEAFKGESWIKIPNIIDEVTTSKILTMEYVPGIKIDNLEKLDATSGIDRILLGRNLAKAYLFQFCKYGVFNADPHPGNLAVDLEYKGGRLIIYDFGQVSYLTESQCDGILQVIQSIVDLDARACVKAFDMLGAIKPGSDTTALTGKIEENFRTGKVKSRRSKRKSDYEAVESEGKPKDSEVMKAFSLPSQLAFVARAVTQMRGVGVMLDEDWEFIDIVAEMVPELQMEKGAGIGYLADQFFKSLTR